MRYYFMNNDIYFQGKKMPSRKVYLTDIKKENKKVYGFGDDGLYYKIDENGLIEENWNHIPTV